MKHQLRKWTLRLTATVFLISGLLIIIVLNPAFTYAYKTEYKDYIVFHDQPLQEEIKLHLDRATDLVKTSELYNPMLQLKVCLSDGSIYPDIIQKVRGRAFGYGFHGTVVLQGNLDYKNNFNEISGYKWNLAELIAHEATHCFQFDKLGLWKSKPIANLPNWKWEGYSEYIARQNDDQVDLRKNIERFDEAIKIEKDAWDISFADNTIVSRQYYDHWMLVQYCMDVKNMTYIELLQNEEQESEVRANMLDWYENHN